MADKPDDCREWPDDEASRRSDGLTRSGWPRRSPKRFRAVVFPASFAVLGAILLLFPSLGILGLPCLIGGGAATIITLLLAAVGN